MQPNIKLLIQFYLCMHNKYMHNTLVLCIYLHKWNSCNEFYLLSYGNQMNLFLNIVKSNQIWILINFFLLIWCQNQFHYGYPLDWQLSRAIFVRIAKISLPLHYWEGVHLRIHTYNLNESFWSLLSKVLVRKLVTYVTILYLRENDMELWC